MIKNIFLFILILLCGVLGYFLLNREKVIELKNQFIHERDEQIIKIKKEKETLTYEVEARQMTIAEIRQENKELKKKLGNLQQLNDYLSFQVSHKDTIIVTKENIVYKPSDSTYNITYKDNWIKFNEKFNPFASKLQFDYNVYDGYDIVHKKRGNTYYVDIIPMNPNTVVTGVKSFTIKDKKPFYATQAFAFAVGLLTWGLIAK